MKQKIIFLIVFLIILAVLLGVLFWQELDKKEVNQKNLEISYEFIGQVSEIKDNTITAKGYFVIEGQINPPENALNKNQAIIRVNQNTKFKKTTVSYPDPESLSEGETFSFKDMNPKEELVGLETLVKDKENSDILITVKAQENIVNRLEFQASEISYSILAP